MSEAAEIVPAETSVPFIRGEWMTETGLALPDDLSYDEWAAMGPTLVHLARGAMWWIGDWLRYGEHHYGEKFAQAVEATGLALQTLKNAQWVADRYAPAERVPEVPFSHHKAAAALDPEPRRDLLVRAREENLAEYEVRQKVREIKGETTTPAPPPAAPAEGTWQEKVEKAVALLNDALDWEGGWETVKQARALLVEVLEQAEADAPEPAGG